MILYENLKKVNAPFVSIFNERLTNFLDKGWYILGEELTKFEKNFADYNCSNYCLGVANGLDALTLGLKVFDFQPGSEVLLPSNTYIATILSVLNCGLVPILVEPTIEDFLINVNLIEEHITNKTVAIIPVHLYGRICDMETIMSISEKYNLKVIEDCAQAHGAVLNNKKAGTFGHIGAFSFYPTKNLGAIGDAGAILTQEESIYEKIKALRNYGSEKKYQNKYQGLNSRLDEIQALFLNIKLPFLDAINDHKKKLAKIYNKNINNLKISKPFSCSKPNENVFHIYPILTEKRDELKSFLEMNGIFTEIHYPIAPHHQDGYKHLFSKKYPISEIIHQKILSLPISYANTEDEILNICTILNGY
jgi:dTDP-4-amino-4,6-dideoxygalactose transaminase